jgi:hypothetical protein
MTQRTGFVLHVRPDKIDEYVEAHRHVWPEMLEELRTAASATTRSFAAARASLGTSKPTTSTPPPATWPRRT